MKREGILKHIPWMLLGILGAACLGVVALRRGEHISALWIVVASVAVYLVAYRYYSLYIATRVMKLDAGEARRSATPLSSSGSAMRPGPESFPVS